MYHSYYVAVVFSMMSGVAEQVDAEKVEIMLPRARQTVQLGKESNNTGSSPVPLIILNLTVYLLNNLYYFFEKMEITKFIEVLTDARRD